MMGSEHIEEYKSVQRKDHEFFNIKTAKKVNKFRDAIRMEVPKF
jgi:hypothetical protein